MTETNFEAMGCRHVISKESPKTPSGLAILAFVALLAIIYQKASAYSETRLLPYYAVRTLLRLGITYIVCLAFGLGVGILADRVLVMAPRPGRMIAEVKIDIPLPRSDYVRSSVFFDHVDRIEDILEKAGIENIEHV